MGLISGAYGICEFRDCRLQNYYGERDDIRKRVIDWDYQTQVREVASIIHSSQYLKWRMCGIAFELGDAAYDCPNNTFFSCTEGLLKKGKEKG